MPFLSRRSPQSLRAMSLFNTLLLAGTIATITLLTWYVVTRGDDNLEVSVTTAEGAPVPDALVQYGHRNYRADDHGEVRVRRNRNNHSVRADHPGYRSSSDDFDPETTRRVHLTLAEETTPTAPNQTADTAPAASNSPAAQSAAPAATSPSVPANVEIAGTVLDESGTPVLYGWVTDGTHYAFTDDAGTFTFPAGSVGDGARLTVNASNFKQQTVHASASKPVSVKMERIAIHGLYFNPNYAYTDETIQHMIDLANTTEINAIVVDIKEETVYYDSQVPLFVESGTVSPVMDIPNLLKRFHDNNIYVIARLVVFKDSMVAETHPDLALKDDRTGDLWRDMNGIAWVDPTNTTLWDANISLALEAASLGFDEIQYDYVRFPTDGETNHIVYPADYTEELRSSTIEGFLTRSKQALMPTGIPLSADVFGYTTVSVDDVGIGQNLAHLTPILDYVSPMLYPSHWPEGSMALDGPPNDFPYDTIEIAMSVAFRNIGEENAVKMRPWLQDFSMAGMTPYDRDHVRAQIDAAEDLGLEGWLLWAPDSVYTEDALNPEPGSLPSTPNAIVPAVSERR